MPPLSSLAAIAVVSSIIILDQLSKFYIQAYMTPGASIPICKGIFHITYVLNPGAAFGMLANQTVFFLAVAVIMLLASVYFYRRVPACYSFLRWSICLMTGGSLGNVIDRLQTGYVVDFLDFRIWPVFNIADIAIVAGVSGIVFAVLRFPAASDAAVTSVPAVKAGVLPVKKEDLSNGN